MRSSRYADSSEPDEIDDTPIDETQELIDTPEPDPTTLLVPLFPPGGTPFYPPEHERSRCPHHCSRCKGAGVYRRCGTCKGEGELYNLTTGDWFSYCFECGGTGRGKEPVECPDCNGTGEGPIPEGEPFVCMTCGQSGKDGWKALPLNVQPLPTDEELEAMEQLAETGEYLAAEV